jgi:hypothetical protein
MRAEFPAAVLPPSWRTEGQARLAAGFPGVDALLAHAAAWDDLPADRYLRDGGRYRYRRHACFVHDLAHDSLELAPRRAHWQSTLYNALHGGMQRWFEPIVPAIADDARCHDLLRGLGGLFAAARPAPRWYIEAHQFRIDTADGIGRPTPEGAHRDGVDFVAIVLVRRDALRGGETRVFPAQGAGGGERFTMQRPGETLLLDDTRVIHETTPIQPLAPGSRGVRDTLVLTYRAGGFQGPERDAA